MKEEIYTIPVTDGFNEDCECAFCAMERTLENNTIAYIMSPAYMETDVREQTNRLGFCKSHMNQLYRQKNVLGLSLMVQSYMDKQTENLKDAVKRFTPPTGGLFQSKKATPSPMLQFRQNLQCSCYICNRIEETMARYLKTFFYLWKNSPDFQNKVLSSKAFCLLHFSLLYERCGEFLSGNKSHAFRESIYALQEQNMNRVKEDLDWFIQKFDYRFRDEPWKNSKDALPRSINKINSQFSEK